MSVHRCPPVSGTALCANKRWASRLRLAGASRDRGRAPSRLRIDQFLTPSATVGHRRRPPSSVTVGGHRRRSPSSVGSSVTVGPSVGAHWRCWIVGIGWLRTRADGPRACGYLLASHQRFRVGLFALAALVLFCACDIEPRRSRSIARPRSSGRPGLRGARDRLQPLVYATAGVVIAIGRGLSPV
jgi:hypothetical protein